MVMGMDVQILCNSLLLNKSSRKSHLKFSQVRWEHSQICVQRFTVVLPVGKCTDGSQICSDIGGRSVARNHSSSVHIAPRGPNKKGIWYCIWEQCIHLLFSHNSNMQLVLMFKAFVFVFILGLFNSTFDYVASNSMMTVNSYLKWLWKELVVPNSEFMWHDWWKSQTTSGYPVSGLGFNTGPLEYTPFDCST